MASKVRDILRRPRGLIGRSILVVAAIVFVQLAASVAFYQAIDRQTLREDHARRIAELLVVGDRVSRLSQADLDQVMTSRYLEAEVVSAPPLAPSQARAQTGEADAIVRYVRQWEPGLAGRPLRLWSEDQSDHGRDLVGVMGLSDGRWLSFRSRHFPRPWPIALRAVATTLAFSLACVALGAYALRQLGEPLRRLAEAAGRVGEGPPQPVAVEGPTDLAELGRAFNDMQQRITGLIEDQARAMEALSHDLRTPLARLKLASDYVEPEDIRALVGGNVDELEEMLRSLSAWLRAQHAASTAESVDLPALIRAVIARWPKLARYEGPKSLTVSTHRDPLEQALIRLVDNAVRFGGKAKVRLVADDPEGPRIEVLDQGPGLTDEVLARIYEPFFRGDAARARDTGGFGLGIPTADRLLKRFGGRLQIANRDGGGVTASVWPPAGEG
ncbi:HAMP domain-containing histidine kinase [Caulobacter sp. 602-2]|uniref:histidine kinase n=1 Tax=Caulobacter sp. 602-2 TaxID=2710887 RepID=A0A6G4QVB5_9CAUL|nr:HAMP domain-containing sensor histidine kinase [Caulobacter sp. 602-2]NGM49472.1 HAMP domain-containing histidine kinase [Caulobacter sp. 602-2]